MILLTVLLAMTFSATCNIGQQSMPVTLPWVVLAGIGAGSAVALQVPMAPEVLGGLVTVPLVSVGLWMGAMLRMHPQANNDSDQSGPTHMTLSAFLTMFIVIFTAWAVHKLPLNTTPQIQRPEPEPNTPLLAAINRPSRRPSSIKPAAPLSPVFGDESTLISNVSNANNYSDYYGQANTTLDHLQSLLPH
jgi:hypothetical protein